MKTKLLTVVMLLCCMFGLIPTNVLAETTNDTTFEELTALKVAEKNKEKVGEYEIKISVPGNEKTVVTGYNFLFVLDASTSTNNTKWNNMRQAVIDTVDVLLPNDDASLNINRVGLMTFGIGSHLNISLTGDKSEFSNLPVNAGQSLLLPGRSATNNEVGLRGAKEYLASLSKDLKKDKTRTYVLYLTDGESNLNETPTDFYKVGQETYLYDMRVNIWDSMLYYHDNSNVDVCQVVLDLYNKLIGNGSLEKFISDYEKMVKECDPEDLLNKVLGEDATQAEKNALKNQQNTIKNNINQKAKILYDNYTNVNEANKELLNQYIDKVFDLIGYDKTKKYSAGDYERLVNNYKFSSNLSAQQTIENFLYYPIFAVGGRVTNSIRAVEEGNKLKEYATIYTIAYNTKGGLTRDDAKKIMDPNYVGNEKDGYPANTPSTHFSSGYYFTTIEKILGVFETLTGELIYTNYINSSVVDYTSKWVMPLDTNNDDVFDEKDITLTNNGKVIENPDITVVKLTSDEIKNSLDPEVNGNTNGDIYKITWRHTEKYNDEDRLELSYKVKVDTQEEGFVSDIEYKANGKTTLTYDVVEIGPDGQKDIATNVVYDIKVPTIKQKENTIVITKTDDDGNLLKGSDFNIVSEKGLKQVKKEYSTDGKTWSETNNQATYFKFSGLYDYEYVIEEHKTPEGYQNNEEELTYDFINQEGQNKETEVVNKAKKGTIVVHYVIKIEDVYIPLNVYGKDEEGNVTDDFIGIPLDDDVITDKLGQEYTITSREIPDYNLVGLYDGNILTNNDINKLEDNQVTGQIGEGTKEYTYVYEPTAIGDGDLDDEEDDKEELPPQTGIESNETSVGTLISMIITTIILFINVSFKRKNSKN